MKNINKNIKLALFYSVCYIPLICLMPNSSSIGWMVGVVCGVIGQDILKNK